ncbi:hypothetical protein K435DRAFT_119025 [Dendrothele bispora CBS 962.96]|uniref:Peptidase A1 domain-containing protein n=1 Tax=Dendrothele bispora (strain CBS 962.96) TaxID=1314807 RepID=A0A4S8MSE8_DENBC|nr:hypothetical protein K435DRAFT_119025 [Dendrothele bispora CBS 962.96]
MCSWDLWVSGDVPDTKDLGVDTTLVYAMGPVKGRINAAQVELDGFVVQDQAYISVATEDFSGFDGMIGLGPSKGSSVSSMLSNSTAGLPILDRIFRENLTVPNHLTLLLSRDSGGSAEQFPAQLTIGTVLSGLEAVLESPKLPALTDQFGVQHWQSLLDANGIVGPDGQRIDTTTSIPNPTVGSADQLHVMFDSGFTIPQLPGPIVDSIYGRIPGAEFIVNGSTLNQLLLYTNFWRIPCNYEVNVSFIFAGQEFPVAPLDLNLDTGLMDSSNKEICIAFYQQIAGNVAGNFNTFGAIDMILGMAFLRNTYTLINFGNFVDGSTDNVADPYIQLLSVSNKTQIHTDFVNVRLGGRDTTGSQAPLLSNIQPRPESNSNDSGAEAGNNGSGPGGQSEGSGTNSDTDDNDSSASRTALSATGISILAFLVTVNLLNVFGS